MAGPTPGEALEPGEVHRREPGKPPVLRRMDRAKARTFWPGLAGAEHECEHLVVGERTDAEPAHPLAGPVVVRDIGKRNLLFVWDMTSRT